MIRERVADTDGLSREKYSLSCVSAVTSINQKVMLLAPLHRSLFGHIPADFYRKMAALIQEQGAETCTRAVFSAQRANASDVFAYLAIKEDR